MTEYAELARLSDAIAVRLFDLQLVRRKPLHNWEVWINPENVARTGRIALDAVRSET